MNLNDPLVSIITPSYNSARFISETIYSVVSQSFINWEMIIVDDSSKDNTVEIIARYTEKEERVKLIKLDNNVGAAEAIRQQTGCRVVVHQLDSEPLKIGEPVRTAANWYNVDLDPVSIDLAHKKL